MTSHIVVPPHQRARRRLVAVLSVMAIVAAGAAVQPSTAQASQTPRSFTVSVGPGGGFRYPDDTPAGSFTAKDGTYYFQESDSLYGAGQPRQWSFYTGSNMDDATLDKTLSDAVNPANPKDRNNNTTWRCNNSPTGKEATYAAKGSGYVEKNYCDLIGVWVDPDTGDWYGLVHNEFTPDPFGTDGLHYDAVDYAVSTDQGQTWTIEGHVLTSPYATKRDDTTAFPEQTYYYGDGDPRLFVDTASGYFYVYYGSRTVDKSGGWVTFYEHVARAPISAKMAPSSWRKYYDGSWSQPGIGGKESNLIPVSASNPRGYTSPSDEYKPATPGTIQQQLAAGTAPPTSPLFAMDITWDAYLGVYISEPQAVDQSGNAPQQYYWTSNLATQKWHLLGDTGSLHDASWYRWFLDSVNKTSGDIVGKTFRSYCAVACADGKNGAYANVTVTPASPAAPPVSPGHTYRITDGQGRMLAQLPGSGETVSWPASARSALAGWRFVSNGDGSYSVLNAQSGEFLGVDSASIAGRAWGSQPTVTPEGPGGPAAGQQWWLVRDTSPISGRPLGTFRLVNRYSNLVLGLPAAFGASSETVPVRTWSCAGQSPAQQVMTITPVRAW
jgi:Ricin-type beta-trefoil lectin domain-like